MEHYYTQNDLFGEEYWFFFGRCYHDAVARAPTDRPSRFIEIGAWKGRSTAYLGVEIVNSGKPITLYVVDTFEGSKEHHDAHMDCTMLYQIFERNLRPVAELLKDRFRVYRMTSVQAAHRLAKSGKKFDFIFLDGSHELEDVAADLEAWRPLLAPGGMIAGDDWRWATVRIAVEREFGKGRVQVPMNQQWPWWMWTSPLEHPPPDRD